VVELEPLDDDSIRTIVRRAVTSEYGLKGAFTLDDDALEEIVTLAGGDGRASLTSLELASQMAAPAGTATPEEPVRITRAHVLEANPRHGLSYDKSGDMHYDIISAFIKSMRGSDPDAALYWLARMLDAGEDPKFIARRIFILASEDIGNADPQALLVAEAAFKATEVIGLPECRINLAQAVEYMALAPKSNAAEAGIDAALKEVREGPRREVPSYLRDRHRPGSDEYGPYLYPHNYPTGWVEQRYLPEGLERGAFYHPSPRGWEAWRIEATARDRAGLQPKPADAGENGAAGAAGADAAANGADPTKNDAPGKA
jgi:putative ATPase